MQKDRFIFGLAHNMVVIADPSWWMQNHIEIENWIEENFGIDHGSTARQGMVLKFNSDEEELMFKMMWGN